jgi:hypothetical protein
MTAALTFALTAALFAAPGASTGFLAHAPRIQALGADNNAFLAGKAFQVAIVAKNGAALARRLRSFEPTPPSYVTPKPPDVLDEDKDIAVYPLSLRQEDVRVVKFTDLFK